MNKQCTQCGEILDSESNFPKKSKICYSCRQDNDLKKEYGINWRDYI
jgi:hypothetical protein